MARYLAGRLFATLLLVFIVSSAAFLVTRLAPGDVAQTTLGFGATEANLARARHEAHLDRPLLVQWALWAGSAVRLDFGTSALYQRPVTSLVGERALNTGFLAVVSLAVALGLGIPAGFVTATRPRSLAARALRVASLVLVSVPPFIGSLALVFLAVQTGVFPAGGITSAGGDAGLAQALDVI